MLKQTVSLFFKTPAEKQCAGLFSLFHCFIRDSMHDFQDAMVLAEAITDPGST